MRFYISSHLTAFLILWCACAAASSANIEETRCDSLREAVDRQSDQRGQKLGALLDYLHANGIPYTTGASDLPWITVASSVIRTEAPDGTTWGAVQLNLENHAPEGPLFVFGAVTGTMALDGCPNACVNVTGQYFAARMDHTQPHAFLRLSTGVGTQGRYAVVLPTDATLADPAQMYVVSASDLQNQREHVTIEFLQHFEQLLKGTH